MADTKKKTEENDIVEIQRELERFHPHKTCAFCEEVIFGEVHHAIHRDGFGEGPEVYLCDGCGGGPTPTCEEIWAKISRGSP